MDIQKNINLATSDPYGLVSQDVCVKLNTALFLYHASWLTGTQHVYLSLG